MRLDGWYVILSYLMFCYVMLCYAIYIHASMHLSIHPSIRLSVHPPIHPSIHTLNCFAKTWYGLRNSQSINTSGRSPISRGKKVGHISMGLIGNNFLKRGVIWFIRTNMFKNISVEGNFHTFDDHVLVMPPYFSLHSVFFAA